MMSNKKSWWTILGFMCTMLMDDIERYLPLEEDCMLWKYSSVLVSVTQMASIEQPSSILQAVQSCYSSQALGPAQGRHHPANVAVGHETSQVMHARASREKMARSGLFIVPGCPLLEPPSQPLLRGCRSREVSTVAPKWVGHLLPAAWIHRLWLRIENVGLSCTVRCLWGKAWSNEDESDGIRRSRTSFYLKCSIA